MTDAEYLAQGLALLGVRPDTLLAMTDELEFETWRDVDLVVLYRAAALEHHPDRGGDARDFGMLSITVGILRVSPLSLVQVMLRCAHEDFYRKQRRMAARAARMAEARAADMAAAEHALRTGVRAGLGAALDALFRHGQTTRVRVDLEDGTIDVRVKGGES